MRQGELGTAPMPATGGGEQVVQAQSLEPLGPELRLSSEPAYADLWLNDVRLSNPWLGRLPLGKQVLRASQPGGPAVSHVFEVTASAPKVLVLHLDGSGASQTGSKTLKHAIELVPAFLIGSSMGSETEETCGEFQCTNRTPALGGLGYVRFSLSFARKMRFELSAGVVYLTSKLERQFTDDTLPDFEPVTYDLSDKLRVRGPFVSTGLAFQHSVAKNVDLGGRLALGLSQMFSRHRTEGTLSADAGSGTVAVSHSDAVERNVMLFGMPELFVGYHESLWRFGAGFGAFVIMNRAALSKHGEIWPEQRQSAPCDGIGCAPPSNAIAGERPFGPSALVSMSLYAGLAF